MPESRSRNPYHIEGQPPQPVRSVVIYVDVLGYTDMAKRANETDDQGFFHQLYEALEEGQEWLRDDDTGPWALDKDRYAIKAFTDNIVIGWPVRDNAESELTAMLSMASFFQMQMANRGFFLRGAISLVGVYVDDVAVYGGAFFESYEAECQAVDPKIVLTDSATFAIRKHLGYHGPVEYAPQYRDLYRDADGQSFLNYLETILIAENEEEAGPFYDQLLLHKEKVEERLLEFRSKPRIWSKYVWVASYHNYFCDQYPQYFDHSHKIDRDVYQTRFSRIALNIV
ncbi:MAG: hypothetical protein ACREBG_05750 [Pyrinomonadaceae bacterium]